MAHIIVDSVGWYPCNTHVECFSPFPNWPQLADGMSHDHLPGIRSDYMITCDMSHDHLPGVAGFRRYTS